MEKFRASFFLADTNSLFIYVVPPPPEEGKRGKESYFILKVGHFID